MFGFTAITKDEDLDYASFMEEAIAFEGYVDVAESIDLADIIAKNVFGNGAEIRYCDNVNFQYRM